MRNYVIETEQLILRHLTENDTEAVFNCCENPNLGNKAGWKPHDTLEESLKILQTIFMEGDVPDKLIKELISHSVEEVIKKLPKKKPVSYTHLIICNHQITNRIFRSIPT